ncbi:MAG: hypothetical protein RL154_723 [Pseudomonadota bacterium]
MQYLLDSALQVAFDGDEKKLYVMLEVLDNIPYWANNVKTLKRIASVTNLKQDILSMERKAAINAIEKCFDKYGADGELEKICTDNGFSDLYQQLNIADVKSID